MKRPAFVALLLCLTSVCTAYAEPVARRRHVDVRRPFTSELAKLGRAPVLSSRSPSASAAPDAAASEAIVPMPVPGFGDAVVSLPIRRSPSPVMVVAHGNRDDPGTHCDYWRKVTNARGFVVCVRGTPRPDNAGFTHGKELPAEIDAAVLALRARYGAAVDPGPMIFAGYSQGAYLGTAVVMKSPSRFTRAIMIEGIGGGWNEHAYAKAGGQRVLYACGQASCEGSAKPVVARLEKAGVGARVFHAKGAGHTPFGAVEEGVKAHFGWVTEGDQRWR